MKTSLFKSLYFQVLTAIAIGILLGHYYPELGAQMKPLGDAFVKLIKMIIAPVIFCRAYGGGCPAVLRDCQYDRADYRPDYCQRGTAWRGHER